MWAPMYDNLSFDKNYWKKIKYINIKLLSFSKKIKIHADKLDCQNIELKYFFKPKENEIIIPKEKINIFFWYRYDLKLKDWILEDRLPKDFPEYIQMYSDNELVNIMKEFDKDLLGVNDYRPSAGFISLIWFINKIKTLTFILNQNYNNILKN